MWRDYFSVEYAIYNDTVIFKAKVKYYNEITAFSFPLGRDVYGSIEKIIEYCQINELPVAFCTVTCEDIKMIESVFNNFKLQKESDWSDYIYISSDLVSLSGRKYSGQRNHINYFKNTYDDYSFEEISKENITDVKNFYVRLSSDLIFTNEIAVEEHHKTIEVLDNYDIYNLPGGLLRAGRDIVAFSIGEIINDVLFIHIEKADIKVRGAYQMINNEFAKHFVTDDITYINREEDVGDEGLRISKLSYHPHEIVDKYILIMI